VRFDAVSRASAIGTISPQAKALEAWLETTFARWIMPVDAAVANGELFLVTTAPAAPPSASSPH
jgi:hypothetical protein